MGKSFDERLNQGPDGDRADYQAGAGADEFEKANKDASHRSDMIQVQRQANRVWGNPPESQGDATERRNAS